MIIFININALLLLLYIYYVHSYEREQLVALKCCL